MINVRTAFTAGNHSVSITAADSIGLSARNIVPFTMVDTTRTNRELMLKDYNCSITYILYTIVKFHMLRYENVYMPNVLSDESKSVQHAIIGNLAPFGVMKVFNGSSPLHCLQY